MRYSARGERAALIDNQPGAREMRGRGHSSKGRINRRGKDDLYTPFGLQYIWWRSHILAEGEWKRNERVCLSDSGRTMRTKKGHRHCHPSKRRGFLQVSLKIAAGGATIRNVGRYLVERSVENSPRWRRISTRSYRLGVVSLNFRRRIRDDRGTRGVMRGPRSKGDIKLYFPIRKRGDC